MVSVKKRFDDNLTFSVERVKMLMEESHGIEDLEYDISIDGIDFIMSAYDLIQTARKELCVEIRDEENPGDWHMVKDAMGDIDPIMANFMVAECFYRGGMCPYQNLKGCLHNVSFLKQLIADVPESFYRQARNDKAVQEQSLILEERG